MWNDIYLLHRVIATKKVNGFLYFLQKLPWIGKKIPNKVYRLLGLKRFLSILMIIFSLLGSLLKNFLYLFLVVLLPILLSSMESDTLDFALSQQLFLMIYLLFTGCCGALLNGLLWRASDETYIMIRLLHMESKRYLLTQSLYQYGWNTLTLMIAAFITNVILRLPFWYAMLFACLYLCSHVSLDAIYLYLYEKKATLFMMNNKYKSIIPIVVFFLAIFLIWQRPSMPYIYHIFFIVCFCFGLLSLWAIHYLKQSQSYKKLVLLLIEESASLDLLTKSKGDDHQVDVVLNEKDYTKEELKQGITTKKHGYAYMNELFFKRHKRLIYKPIKRRVIIILVPTVLLFVLSFFIKDVLEPTSLMALLPPFVFLLYLLNISERACRAMFMNCDVSLLHYGYYRQKEAIFTNFRIRLWTLSKYNLFLVALVCLSINLIAYVYKITFTWQSLLLFDFTLIVLSFFFSLHYLFVYYIFQPYNEELDMKNPFLSILNAIVYFLCYLSLRIEGSYVFTIGVLIVTLLYIAIASLLVWKLAFKTFHLK